MPASADGSHLRSLIEQEAAAGVSCVLYSLLNRLRRRNETSGFNVMKPKTGVVIP
jgi:hypothetical protein